jgi:DNA-binding LacI/PurR family transcriptional regulator
MHEYERVKDDLLRRISSGDLSPQQQLAPVRQMSKDLGISLATVHRAVRELIQEGHLVARDRHGVFVADTQVGDNKVGLLLALPVESMNANSMFGPLFNEAQRRLLLQGAAVVTMQCMQSTPAGVVLKPPASVASLGLRGAILVRVLDLPYIASLVQLRMPIVATDVDATDAGAHCVQFDNLGSAFALTRHLIARGHKRILFVGGARKSSEGDDRWRYDMAVEERSSGFRLALESAGLASDLQAYCATARNPASFKEALLGALRQGEPFTAVVTEEVVSVRDALRQAGRPEVEVAGWVTAKRDTESLLEGSVVGLAVCDFTALGELAVAVLESCLAQRSGAVRRELLKPQLLLAPAGSPAALIAGGA